MKYCSLYAAFEIHPSHKGASTHITQMTDALAGVSDPLLLCTIKGEEQENHNHKIHSKTFDGQVPHYLDRGRMFSSWLRDVGINGGLQVFAQFRDIWSGLPVLESRKAWMNIFEVNGLPSVELPYRYPDLSTETIKKIRKLEMHCLVESDLLICPSHTIKSYIVTQGIHESKIEVITNGATLLEKPAKGRGLPSKYITYFGAMQLWQGVDVLIKAFSLVKDIIDLDLVLCNSQRDKFARPYRKLAAELGIENRVHWYERLGEDELNRVISHSLFTVAPLKETTRNILQGCSPLKIFESMAKGIPVLASDIPVVREIITDGYDGRLVRPDRHSELSRMIRMMVDYPEVTRQLGEQARKTIIEKYLWSDIKMKLNGLYSRQKVSAA